MIVIMEFRVMCDFLISNYYDLQLEKGLTRTSKVLKQLWRLVYVNLVSTNMEYDTNYSSNFLPLSLTGK